MPCVGFGVVGVVAEDDVADRLLSADVGLACDGCNGTVAGHYKRTR